MKCKKNWGLGAVAAASLLAVPALAQDREERVFKADEARRSLTHDLNVGVSGGLSAFTGELGEETVAGGFLGVQASSRPLPLLGVELGYEGSRNAFEDISGGLWRHNLGALAKVGPELGVDRNLRPFVGAGIGVSLLNPSEAGEVPFDNDFITEVPLAAGVEYDIGGITAGARASYRLLGGENLGVAESGNIVNIGVQVGGAF